MPPRLLLESNLEEAEFTRPENVQNRRNKKNGQKVIEEKTIQNQIETKKKETAKNWYDKEEVQEEVVCKETGDSKREKCGRKRKGK